MSRTNEGKNPGIRENSGKLKKPEWLRVRYNQALSDEMGGIMARLGLNTVCTGASCPNLGECWRKKTATFMILGNKCTRNCRFCDVPHGNSADFANAPVDFGEAERIARAAAELGLAHIVVTCVTRDDLPDGGASLFAAVIREVREKCHGSTVEVLISDLGGSAENLGVVMAEKPDVLGHNIETVPSLYKNILPGSDYGRSLEVLRRAKSYGTIVKTSMMLGLGESEEEIYSTIADICDAGADILVLSQYLQPSEGHAPLKRYVTPEEFTHYKNIAEETGIRYVVSSPLSRSSYHAAEAMEWVKNDLH